MLRFAGSEYVPTHANTCYPYWVMAKIRIGVRAWGGAEAAETLDGMDGTRNVMWVEIDGNRVTDVVNVRGEWGEGAHYTIVEFYGPAPEFVYVTKDGVEHGR